MANRRMATDGSEADVDEAGGMSQLRGAKLAFTDIKVSLLNSAKSALHTNAAVADICPRAHVSLYHWCNGFPELLPNSHRNSWLQRHHHATPRCSSVHLHGILVIWAQLHLRQIAHAVPVLDVSNSDCDRWLLRVYVHGQLWSEILQLVLTELRFRHEQHRK